MALFNNVSGLAPWLTGIRSDPMGGAVISVQWPDDATIGWPDERELGAWDIHLTADEREVLILRLASFTRAEPNFVEEDPEWPLGRLTGPSNERCVIRWAKSYRTGRAEILLGLVGPDGKLLRQKNPHDPNGFLVWVRGEENEWELIQQLVDTRSPDWQPPPVEKYHLDQEAELQRRLKFRREEARKLRTRTATLARATRQVDLQTLTRRIVEETASENWANWGGDTRLVSKTLLIEGMVAAWELLSGHRWPTPDALPPNLKAKYSRTDQRRVAGRHYLSQ
jgi:hypothetical protein